MHPPIFVREPSDAERARLEAALRASDAFTVRRAQIVLASAEGRRPRTIANELRYVVHLSETCEDDAVHLLTHAMTTPPPCTRRSARPRSTRPWPARGLVPEEHLVDAAYVDAELLARGREELGIDLVGPPRPNPSWQAKVEGGYTLDRFEVDWDEQRVRCPQGKLSLAWSRQVDQTGAPYVSVWFRRADGGPCPARPSCTRGKHQARP